MQRDNANIFFKQLLRSVNENIYVDTSTMLINFCQKTFQKRIRTSSFSDVTVNFENLKIVLINKQPNNTYIFQEKF